MTPRWLHWPAAGVTPDQTTTIDFSAYDGTKRTTSVPPTESDGSFILFDSGTKQLRNVSGAIEFRLTPVGYPGNSTDRASWRSARSSAYIELDTQVGTKTFTINTSYDGTYVKWNTTDSYAGNADTNGDWFGDPESRDGYTVRVYNVDV